MWQLANELQKPIIEKFEKWKVHSSFINNIEGAVLADIQLTSRFNKGLWFLLYVIDIYSKYAWVVPLEDKKSIRIANAFQKNLYKTKRKPNKIWVDKGSEFYNRSTKSHGCRVIIQKSIQHIINRKLFLVKGILEL